MDTLRVTNGNDSGAGSLREAINAANANPGKDDVFVEVDVTLKKTINITDSINIGTPYGASIAQTGNARIFNIDDFTDNTNINVDLFRLYLNGGNAGEGGGAILSKENLTIIDSEIYNNSARQQGGGIYQQNGSLTVERTKIFDNTLIDSDTKASSGGGIYLTNSEFTLSSSTIENNDASYADGIAVNSSTGKIYASTLNKNRGTGIGVFSNSQVEVIDSNIENNAKFNVSADINSNVVLTDTVAEINLISQSANSNSKPTLNLPTVEIEFSDPISNPQQIEKFQALSSQFDPLTGQEIDDLKPVYTFVNTDNNSLFHTIDEAEQDYIKNNLPDFVFQGVDYYAFEAEAESEEFATIPVFRMLNSESGNHFFSTDQNEINYIQENLPEFIFEDVAFQVLEF